ncbi:monocarboxylate transporter 13-like [Procambarus clarkii]|uniref:monocarboxylate transporter 13-like n=1 Tax=Procambarus clarkii TaxID=6728 RepID=UPI0037423B7E
MSKFNLSLAAENQRIPVVGTGYRNESYVSEEVEQRSLAKEYEGENSVTNTPAQACYHSPPLPPCPTNSHDNENGDYTTLKTNDENHTQIDISVETRELGLPAEVQTTTDLNITSQGRDSTQDDEKEVPDGGWGYIVALACFISFSIVTTTSTCYGILFSKFLEDLGTSSTTNAWIFNTGGFVGNVASFLMGPAVEQFGHRKVALVGAVLGSVGLGISAFATSAWFLFISFSLLTSFGSGMSVLVLMTILPLYFKKRLGRANAFLSMGACMSQIVGPPAITFLQEQYGIKGACLIVAAVLLNNIAAAALLHPVEWHVKSRRKKMISTSGKESLFTSCYGGITASLVKAAVSVARNFALLRSPRAAIIAFGCCFNVIGYVNMLMLVPVVVREKGYTQVQASWCMSISGFCNLVARLVVSSLTDWPRFSMRGFYMVGTATIAFTTIALSHADEMWSVALVMGVWGVGVGAFVGLMNLIMLKYMGLENLVPLYSVTSLLIGFWFLASGPVFGVIRDLSGRYSFSLYALGGSVFVTVLLWFFMPAAVAYDERRELQQRHHQQQEQQSQEAAESSEQAGAAPQPPGQAVAATASM